MYVWTGDVCPPHPPCINPHPSPPSQNRTGALARAHVAGLLHLAYQGSSDNPSPNPTEASDAPSDDPIAALATRVPATLQRLFPSSSYSSTTVDWPAFIDRVGGSAREAEEARAVLLGWIVMYVFLVCVFVRA